MPELPEVETVVRELETKIIGQTIKSIEIHWSKTFVNLSEYTLDGQNVNSLARKGKYIIINLDYSVLIVHLRMTGQLLVGYNNDNDQDKKYLRTVISFTNDNNLYFNDKRKFGRIYHIDNADQLLSKIGVDAMHPDFNEKLLLDYLKSSKMNVKSFLLSQKYISGLGNIYVDESLFRASIHPKSICHKIPKKTVYKLYHKIKSVLIFAIEHMGSTISDYRDVNGNPGSTQDFFKVYQQTGKPCPICEHPINKDRIAGRGTHFCIKCQKIYK